MRVFISWSGLESQKVAAVLRDFLPRIVQSLNPWMSDKDLGSGQRWSLEIGGQLSQSDVGIAVVTKDNAMRPWLNFEAGAISRSMTSGTLIPFLFDIKPSALSGPLSQFQARECSKEQLHLLVSDLNGLLGQRALTSDHLRDTFDRFWGSINDAFEGIRNQPHPEAPEAPAAAPSDRQVLEEILSLLRGMRSGPSFVPGGASMTASGSLIPNVFGTPSVSIGAAHSERTDDDEKKS